MNLQFECFEDGRWYVVLPEYEGDQDDLEMVAGADEMCAALSDDGLYVSIDVETEDPESDDYFVLDIEAHDEDGAYYDVKGCDRFSGMVWLCNVVHFIFGDHPDRLYCRLSE